MQTPQLQVISQSSLAENKINKNGTQKTIFVVVKNIGFTIDLGLSVPMQDLDFRKMTIDAALLYDSEIEKMVDFVRIKPLDFKCRPSDNGSKCTVDLRIKVLTSQLEDMFFRIRFRALDLLTKSVYPHLVAYSGPIKVISKPDQITKAAPTKCKKRNLSEMVLDSLQRIEDQQVEQAHLLQRIQSQQLLQEYRPQSQEQQHLKTEDFETAFSLFLTTFHSLPPEERPSKIRKLVRLIPEEELNQLNELLDMFMSEGFHKPTYLEGGGSYGGLVPTEQTLRSCDENCVHKKELERIDQYYKEFLSTSYLSETPSSYLSETASEDS